MSAYTRCDGALASESTLSHPPPTHPAQPRQIAGSEFLHVQVFALGRHFLGSAGASIRRARRGQSPSKATISASTRPLSAGCQFIPHPLAACLPSARITILLQSITSAMFEISALVRYEKVYEAAP